MGFMLPAGVVNTDACYFFADTTLTLGPLVKQVSDQTLIVVDYSNLSPPQTASSWAFTVDVSSNPALVVSYPEIDNAGRLVFLVSGGIAGQQYSLSVTINTSGTPRTDVLTVSIPSSGDCDCGAISPVPMLYTQLPVGEPTQGYVNSAVRYFWGAAPPSNPSVMDQWYNPTTQTLYEWATDGTQFFWETLMSADVVLEAPSSSIIYGRYNGYWVPQPIQADAPSNGLLYSRSNGSWVQDVFQSDAPNDGRLYSRQSLGWTPLPPQTITSDAPADGNVYGRLNAGWTIVPPAVIGVDAPADGNSYMRNNRGWTSGGRITGSLNISGNTNIGGTLQVGGVTFLGGNVQCAGQVALDNDPISPEQAANKNYVDMAIQRAFNSNGYPFLQLSGGTMAGPIELAADPVNVMEPVTLRYFIANAPGGLTDAPADGTTYGRLNSTWQNVLATTGGTLTGPLILAGAPTAANGAATKGYVDATVAADVPQPSGSVPAMDGTAATGVSLAYARADHVHPSDASRYPTSNPSNYQTLAQLNTALANYYPTSNPSGYQTAAQVTAMLAPYALISSIPASSSAAPIMDGNAAPGSATAWSRGDHVHPSDTSRLALNGGTMTGPLVLYADPSAPLQAATMQFVTNSASNANIDCGTF